MKWSDILPQSKEQLKASASASRGHLVDLRFKAQAGSLKQVHQFKQARKDLSRTLTRMHQIEHTVSSAKAEEKAQE